MGISGFEPSSLVGVDAVQAVHGSRLAWLIGRRLSGFAVVRFAEDVMVTLTENSLEDWSVGNGIAQLIELGSVPGALSLDGERAGVEAGQVGEGGAALGVKVEAR